MTDNPVASASPRDLDSEALDWFVRHGGSAGAADGDAAFQLWLAEDPRRRLAYQRWLADWRQLDELPAEGIARLQRQLAADRALDDERRKTSRHGRKAFGFAWPAAATRAAMAAVLLTSVGSAGFLAWEQWQQKPIFAHSFATLQGQQMDVELPDGSRVRLDTATQLDVTLYRKRREVRLPEGQAFFQVMGDASRPFDVLAGKVKARVIGTRFSVRNVQGQPPQVSVEEGRVRVVSARQPDAAQPPDTVDLVAGQQVSAREDGRLAAVSHVPAADIAAWRDGMLTFDNVPLGQALAEFARYGNTGLAVRDPAVAALRITGTFDSRRLDNFRRALPKTLPVRLQSEGTVSVITALP